MPAPVKPDLSVVVLCFRAEENCLPFVLGLEEELSRRGPRRFELVLVANYVPGSKDRTPDIVRGLAQRDPNIMPVTLPKQGMLGWDVWSGLSSASGDVIGLVDGDGQTDPGDVLRVYQGLSDHGLDYAQAYRSSREDGIHRACLSKAYNGIFRLLFPALPFRDVNAKPKVFSRKFLSAVRTRCPGWFVDGDIVLEVMRLNPPATEIPVAFRRNTWRGSMVGPRACVEIFGSLLARRFFAGGETGSAASIPR